MDDDLTAQFALMRRYAVALHNLINAAEARAPKRAEGTDRRGAVHVVLGTSGLPDTFRVSADWSRRIKPEGFGGAVVDACQVAMRNRLTAWTSALEDDGWRGKTDRLAGPGGLSASPADDTSASGEPEPFVVPDCEPRSLSDITEDAIRALSEVDRLARQATGTADATGSAAGGRLTLTLSSGGLSSCVADAGWVSKQSAARLASALHGALRQAKGNVASRAEAPDPTTGLDGLFAEAVALLRDVRRFGG